MVRGIVEDDFDLDKIAESGQCFRWSKLSNSYSIIHLDKRLVIRFTGVTKPNGREYELSCSPDEFKSVWYNYFDFRERYGTIRKKVDESVDPFMFKATESEKGIRILRQDPWEVLVSFIISQRKNIPAIKTSLERLSQLCGTKHVDAFDNTVYYSVPTPEQLHNVNKSDLETCGPGYRVDYLKSVAFEVHTGRLDLSALTSLPYDKALYRLKQLYGVGDKIANCVLLFGYHRLNAFPIDVWIEKILINEYKGIQSYPFNKYNPYNGVFQQYMYAYYRHKN